MKNKKYGRWYSKQPEIYDRSFRKITDRGSLSKLSVRVFLSNSRVKPSEEQHALAREKTEVIMFVALSAIVYVSFAPTVIPAVKSTSTDPDITRPCVRTFIASTPERSAKEESVTATIFAALRANNASSRACCPF